MRARRRGSQGGAAGPIGPAALAVLGALLAAPAGAQDADGMEEFPAVDPYTEGDPEQIAELGYVRLGGGFVWLEGDSTSQVREKIGDPDVLWVETEHFVIGSTLVTYDWSGDQDEKEKLEEELEQLEDKLGRAKFPRNELDPWLRLHLAAQRAEAQFDAFVEDFGLEPAAWADEGAFLGRPEKLRLFLCQRDSEFGRHASVYWGSQAEFAFLWAPWEGALGYSVSAEAVARGYRDMEQVPLDSILHCQLADGLATLFVEGYRSNAGGRPYWLANAYAHRAVRRVDARWVSGLGLRPGQTPDADDHEWEPRVKGLVKAEYFAPAREVFGWRQYEDLDVRDHMTSWSRLEYLLEEAKGDRAAFLDAVCVPPPSGDETQVAAALVERQVAALEAAFGLTPEALDEGWARWVKRRYSSR